MRRISWPRCEDYIEIKASERLMKNREESSKQRWGGEPDCRGLKRVRVMLGLLGGQPERSLPGVQ